MWSSEREPDLTSALRRIYLSLLLRWLLAKKLPLRPHVAWVSSIRTPAERATGGTRGTIIKSERVPWRDSAESGSKLSHQRSNIKSPFSSLVNTTFEFQNYRKLS